MPFYPVPFRRLEEYQKFEKYRIVEAQVIRNKKDPRPESHKIDFESLALTETKLSTADFWRERRRWVLSRGVVHDDLTELIAAANERNELSLATFKPTKLLHFKAEPESPDWDAKKVGILQEASKQGDLFPAWQPKELTKFVDKLPWKFSYQIEDSKGRTSWMMIEDWEIGALYWNCIRDGSSPEESVGKVAAKYWDNFSTKDLHLFLGTTREWHGRGKNPFVVIGAFYPPIQNQPELGLFDSA
ncbi:MAG: hypothetical protein AAGC74_03660 [Verrucomicrobiota bacterium]